MDHCNIFVSCLWVTTDFMMNFVMIFDDLQWSMTLADDLWSLPIMMNSWWIKSLLILSAAAGKSRPVPVCPAALSRRPNEGCPAGQPHALGKWDGLRLRMDTTIIDVCFSTNDILGRGCFFGISLQFFFNSLSLCLFLQQARNKYPGVVDIMDDPSGCTWLPKMWSTSGCVKTTA